MKYDLQNGEKRSCKPTRNLNNAPCWKQNFKNSLGSYMGGVFSLSQCCFLLKAFHFFIEFFTWKEKREGFIRGFHRSRKWLFRAKDLTQNKKRPKTMKCVYKINLNKIKNNNNINREPLSTYFDKLVFFHCMQMFYWINYQKLPKISS